MNIPMQQLVPTEFKLFSTTIKVEFNNQRTDDLNAYGGYQPENTTIFLANKYGIHDLSKDQILDTFYHEKVHTILRAMNELELNQNEKFVDVFAKLLRQSDETTKYNL